MSVRRFLEIFRRTFVDNARRPLVWVLIVILALCAWGLSSGSLRIATGDSDTGGHKAWMTSQFALARTIAPLVFLLYSFFVAVAAGMLVIRDDEERIGELLHSTPLTTREYVWGKWLAVLALFLGILVLQLGFHAVALHLLAGADQAEFIGPFSALNYAVPALLLSVPMLVFMAGASFALGTWTRKPIPVFFLPAALLLACLFFLWGWNPSWLKSDWPLVDQVLMWIDPAGLRWLDHTWLDVDRGVEFYNHAPIGVDLGFGVSRAVLILLGLAAVHLAERRLHATLRGARGRVALQAGAPAGDELVEQPRTRSLGELAMSARAPGLFRGLWEVARVELRELKSQPGLYLFVPLILLQTLTIAAFRVGPFDTPVLSTSGTLAAEQFNTLALLVCLLLLFYTVESLERERARGLAAIYYATPVRSASILFGKNLANSLVGGVILLASFLACVLVLIVQGKAPLELTPFAILWGVLLVPTFFVWCSFVTALYATVRERYTSYALALALMVFCGWRQLQGDVSWVDNWNLWGTVRWSDMGPLELDRAALLANRALYVTIGIALTAFAVRMFPRRSLDPATVLLRLRPMTLLRSLLGFAPFLIAPLVLGGWLARAVNQGRGGAAMEKRAKDYWRKNLATWKDAPQPSIVDVVLDLELKPEERWFRADGEYTLLNDRSEPLARFAVTPGMHFEQLAWRLDGQPFEPEDRSGLRVFTLPEPLAPGAKLRLGFRHEGRFPDGISKNGGGASEFILPSGVVLTSFSPSVTPVIGFIEGVGVDEDNRYDARDYPEDFYAGVTRSAFGNNTSATTRITLHVPEAYGANSVGVLESETLADGVRTAVWSSDYPVEFFNVVCGKWDTKRGVGTALYYHPAHDYNVDEMLQALDGARKYYSAWFGAFPWSELKLSEFAAHASYAQGFPTDITFSESIGFLAKSDPRSRVAFVIAAHEAAHQWWGNLLVPGEGPGGNLLSEGLAHFSTILLVDELRGLRERIEFCKRIETSYAESRQVDSEKPLVKVDGSRAGDTSVTYDKGGWVFWMLLNHMGRERALAGLQAFLAQYHHNPDHPVLQDFVATLRAFAPDAERYDAFTRQWFFEVVVPEYELSEAARELQGEAWQVTVTVKNVGAGSMPLEVCAARGERFPEDEDGAREAPEPVDDVVLASETKSAYRDARTTLTLAAGESRSVTLSCDFEPERVLVDPDALVLQLRREQALVRF